VKELETAQNKIAKICDALRRETLEPAEKEAEKIVAYAQEEAKQIISDAKEEAASIKEEAKRAMQKERSVFQSALEQAGKQTLETLRQRIEKEFFNRALFDLLTKETNKPEVVSGLIESVIQAIEKEGVTQDISCVVSKDVSLSDVNAILGQRFLERLQKESVSLGDFDGGIKVKLHDKRITIDLSASALLTLFATHVARKEFRKLLFASV